MMQRFLSKLSVFLIACTFFLVGANDQLSAQESFAPIVKKVMPAVVNISATSIVNSGPKYRYRGAPLPKGHPYEEFFREFFGNQSPDRKRKAKSLGSGFIIDAKGYIVTNHHVIEGAEAVQVTLHNDKVMEAEIIGYDQKTDLALLKIESKEDLPFVVWGNSDDMEVGDWVLAIGNPFGLGGTVTAGIVSARARVIGAGPYDDFIQTDASINKGNSGGPMFNGQGDVIGVNTAIYSPSGGNVGIGFAIPSEMAKNVIAQLKTHGVAKRGWIGVVIQKVTEDIADGLGLKTVKGALVSHVEKDGPADQAGLKAGDIILAFNGQEIIEMRELPRIVAATKVGETVTVKVWRNQTEVELQMTITEMDSDENARKISGQKEKVDIDLLGVRVSTDYELGKVYIKSIERNSLAAQYGLKKGDFILEVNQKIVETAIEAKDMIDAIVKSGAKTVLLLVSRKDRVSFVAIPIANNR